MRRFISTARHTDKFVYAQNRIGAVIPDDMIFASIHTVLQQDLSLNPSHKNDFKIGMKSLKTAAESQGKFELPKRVLSNSKPLELLQIMVPSYDHRESLAYLALRSIANFAAAQVIFKEIKKRCPDFKPESLLDWGTGTGSVFWSATNVWKDDVKQAIGVDVSGLPMIYLNYRTHDKDCKTNEYTVKEEGSSQSRATVQKADLGTGIIKCIKFKEYNSV
jgi:ribosomal protein RSM22 (predicted rRNA methylase)